METKTLFKSMVALSALLVVAACNSEAPAPVTPNAAPTPATATTPAPPAGAFFRDDFDGSGINEANWTLFAQSGIAVVQDGKLDLLNSGGQVNFPYLVNKNTIIPQEGPFYFEMAFKLVSAGRGISFCLDYLPPEEPGTTGVTTPFMRTMPLYDNMQLTFDIEGKPLSLKAEKGSSLNVDHKLRVEGDADNYRVIVDGKEVGTFSSKRRPMKFWLGAYPQKDVPPSSWQRVQVDYIAAGVLTEPAPAEPAPTPTPTPEPQPEESGS